MAAIGDVVLVVGACLVLLAAIGVVRFADVLARMHAGAKASTLGIVLVGIGAAMRIQTAGAVVTVMLVIVLQLVASPVGSHVIARAVYRRDQVVLAHDELADDDPTPQRRPPTE